MIGNLIVLIVIVMIIKNQIQKSRASQTQRQSRTGRHDWQANKAAGQDWQANKAAGQDWQASKVTGQDRQINLADWQAANAVRHGGSGTKGAQTAPKAQGRHTAERRAEVSPAEETSTTAYLNQKAEADRIEHAKEKQIEALRLHRETGGRKAAERYLDWDSVPAGKRIVKCSYCGAENLVGNRQDPHDFTCYFCREIL